MARIDRILKRIISLRNVASSSVILAVFAGLILSACTVVVPDSNGKVFERSGNFVGFPDPQNDFLNYRVDKDGNIFVSGTFNDDSNAAEGNQLEVVPVRVPKNFANGKLKLALNDISQGKKDYRTQIDSIDIIFLVRGSKYGTRCHDQGGDYHCHPN